jgi:hypothetical protein
MRAKRHTEVNVLGYRIERVQTFDPRGDVEGQWYEVLAPESQVLLASFPRRAEAERAIVERELAALRRVPAA